MYGKRTRRVFSEDGYVRVLGHLQDSQEQSRRLTTMSGFWCMESGPGECSQRIGYVRVLGHLQE